MIRQLLALTIVVSVVVGCAPRPIHFMREGPAPAVVPKQSSWKVTPSWRFYTGETYDSADIPLRPVVGGSQIFVAEPGGKVYALESVTGNVVWQIDSKLDLSAGVGFGHGVVVVASAEGQLLALDPTDGKLLWQSSVGAEVLARPIIAGEHIIVRAGDGQVIGVDKNSGTISWRLRNNVPSLSVRGLSMPVQVNEIVVVGYASGHLSGIEIESGRELWKTPISRPGGSNQIDRLSDIDADELLKRLNKSLDVTSDFLKTATHVIITLGTSWVYRERNSENIVANCHKVPQKQFVKELLSIGQIEESLLNTINKFKSANQNINIIFTISPVRHLKDGFVENQRSKAHLISALHSMVDRGHSYFPSYELQMDELRDYRFYKEDMVHPNKLAIDYIWNKFKMVWISEGAYQVMDEIETVQKGLAHKPFQPKSEAHQQFLNNLQTKIKKLQDSHPHIKFGG